MISNAATSKPALGKQRGSCSSLWSKCYTKDSSVTTADLAPPQFWLCWVQNPNLKLSESAG